MGGWLQFRRGEVGWGRRRGNRGRECRHSGYILAFIDGITDDHVPSVYPSVISLVNVPRHWTEIPVWILDHFVGKIIWKKSMSSHRCNFPKNYIICRWYGWYIPTDCFYQYIPTISPTNIVYVNPKKKINKSEEIHAYG